MAFNVSTGDRRDRRQFQRGGIDPGQILPCA
jgi:hypothetical protein